MSDLISRQAAIDVVDSETVSTNPEHFKSSEKFIKFMDDDDIASFGKWQWANGFNTALTATSIQLKKLPFAQPEQRWIPCSERLPENRVSVIVCFREWQQYAKRYVYSIVVGWYARKHSVHENVFSYWESDCEYDEIEDEYYIEEGWYEFTTQGNGDLMNWYINADVIAWMPLPEPARLDGES